ncbi:MAG: hypothetical protein U0031_24175 [Thermomicrobiales bacterium]
MAEWNGPRRTLNSIDSELDDDVTQSTASQNPRSPEAPGAVRSPQIPGLTPDDPDLPGYGRGSLPRLASNRRPLTEYASAQRLLRLFTPPAGTELTAADWEQGAASNEEVRKADLSLGTPSRPLGGYGLGLGRTVSAIPGEALAAVGDGTAVVQEALPQGEPVAVPPQVAVPAGAIRGDGTATCPPEFPIKGNAQSLIYHTRESRSFEATVPEFCFSTVEAAESAGFRAPKN